MSLLSLAWRWLWSRPLAAALHLLMLALGFGTLVMLTLVSEQVEHQASRDLAGIDLVVGAKGSPLQLILAGIFHIDQPPGNIPLQALAQLRAHPQVAEVIPLSLGDSLQGFRIVGSTPALMALYGARVAQGSAWDAPLEAVLGAAAARSTGLAVGQTFAGSHGLGAGGAHHDERPYRVTGVLAPCGCVLDRVVLTATESVWAVHGDDPDHDADHDADGGAAHRANDAAHRPATDRSAHAGEHAAEHATEHPAAHGNDADRVAREAAREVTMLLVRYRSPLAAATLPRWVQAQPGLQAAVPALESARLFRLLGVGLDVLRGLGGLMLAVAGLSVFVGLMHAVREREPDLAMLRMLGAPPARTAAVMLLEAGLLAGLGLLFGLVLGHGLTAVVGGLLQADRSLAITGWWWSVHHLTWPALALVLALFAATWPAWRVHRLDVTTLLQRPH